MLVSSFKLAVLARAGDLRERHSQVGSLAGAAHLLNDNRCPMVSSKRTEISCRPKGEKLT